MHDFVYKNGEMYCEEVPVKSVAQRVGTPFYLYSCNTLANHVKAFAAAFKGAPHLICFALKSNSNGAVLRLLGREGAGADIVSGGELFRALRGGIAPKKIVYAGVGKRRDEIEYALKIGILMFNVESGEELLALDRAAKEMHTKARQGFVEGARGFVIDLLLVDRGHGLAGSVDVRIADDDDLAQPVHALAGLGRPAIRRGRLTGGCVFGLRRGAILRRRRVRTVLWVGRHAVVGRRGLVCGRQIGRRRRVRRIGRVLGISGNGHETEYGRA